MLGFFVRFVRSHSEILALSFTHVPWRTCEKSRTARRIEENLLRFYVGLSLRSIRLSFSGWDIPWVGRILQAGCRERCTDSSQPGSIPIPPRTWLQRWAPLSKGGGGGVQCPWPSISGLWSSPRRSPERAHMRHSWARTDPVHTTLGNRAKSLYMQGSQQPPRVSLT